MIRPATTRRLALRGLMLAAVVAISCHPGPRAALAATAPTLDITDAYRLALLEMKGQLSVARALLQIRAPGAAQHLGAPLEALFHGAEAELERRSAPFTADILGELRNVSVQAPDRGLATIELAVTAINGSFAQTGSIDSESALNLAEALLRAAVERFAAAVENNEVVDLPNYQIGRGFITEAEALIRHASGLRGRPGHEELLEAVVLIRQAWPGIMPPPIVYDPPSVAEFLDRAVAAMEPLR